MPLLGWLAKVSLTMMHKASSQPFECAFQLLSCVSVYGFGMLSRLQRAYTAPLEDRARRLERERAADTVSRVCPAPILPLPLSSLQSTTPR
ncbi:hypothetical protein [Streptomyces sp. NPDC057199]|uniref:hypothetical protein n=1 Tax=Streptomyces sp. NPDC057199 TaxID=3346047 RepID=UPI00362FF663